MVQKSRAAHSETQTKVSLVQSLETVQILLHGSLSILSWCRGIFPERAFDQKRLDLDGSFTYSDYTAINPISQRQDSLDNTLNTQVLLRGRSSRADACLNWLDVVFYALKAGELESLEVRIHPSKTDRQKVLETYSFSVAYLDDRQGARRVAGVDMLSPGGSVITVEASQKALRDALLSITKLCGTLPPLPETRHLTMRMNRHVEGHNNTPHKGWMLSAVGDSVFPQVDGWDKFTYSTSVGAGLHESGMALLTYLQNDVFSSNDGQPLQMPRGTDAALEEEATASAINQDTMVRDSYTHVRADSMGAGVLALAGEPVSRQEALTPALSGRQPFEKAQRVSALRRSTRNASSRKQSQPDSSQLTQSSNVPFMKRFLHDAQQTEYISQGETQVQNTTYPIRPSSISSETESAVDGSPEKAGGLGLYAGCTQPTLGRSTAQALQLRKTTLAGSGLIGASVSHGGATLNLKCTCGSSKFDKDMIVCSCCETQQHPQCYGFIRRDDPRMPTEHVCYACLLGEREDTTLKELKLLSLRRRVMYFAFVHGIRNRRDLARDLALDVTLLGPVLDHLKGQGFLVTSPGSHKAGHAATGKPTIVPVGESNAHKRMLMDLFDPLTGIKHHYDIPARPVFKLSDLTQGLSQLHESNTLMGPPPPTTPRRPLTKGTKEPVSSMRTRSSLQGNSPGPVPETPIPPRSRQQTSAKRAAVEMNSVDEVSRNGVFVDATKRRRVVEETEFGLNANGDIPTSPAGPYC
ncbi:hypothetical protein MBLNU230_g4609t1 [Neophaeotheca triangularis]